MSFREKTSPRELLRLYAQVEWQLLYNFYPPFKRSFINPCIDAVLACQAGYPKQHIDLNDAIGYTGEGQYFQTAEKMVNDFRLNNLTETT